ncbi:6452_t:CDS:2, partial [Acaulospora colombiana]
MLAACQHLISLSKSELVSLSTLYHCINHPINVTIIINSCIRRIEEITFTINYVERVKSHASRFRITKNSLTPAPGKLESHDIQHDLRKDHEEVDEFYSNFPGYGKGGKEDQWIKEVDVESASKKKEEVGDVLKLGAVDKCNHPVVTYLAVRWSLKEATYKALYPHQRITWKDLSVRKVEGKPSLIISKEFQRKNLFNITKTHSSISHDGEYVVAQ